MQISIQPCSMHVTGDERAVSGVALTWCGKQYFYAPAGAAIIKPEAFKRNVAAWYNQTLEKGHVTVKARIWSFTNGALEKMELTAFDPHLISVVDAVALGKLPYFTNTTLTTVKKTPSIYSVLGLIAHLPLPDQFAIATTCIKINALKHVIGRWYCTDKNIEKRKQKKALLELFKYRNPGTIDPERDYSSFADQVFLFSGLLENAFVEPWIYTPTGGRLYALSIDAILTEHLIQLESTIPTIKEDWAKEYARGLTTLKDGHSVKKRRPGLSSISSPLHPAELVLVRRIHMQGTANLLTSTHTWDLSLKARASYYLHQLEGWWQCDRQNKVKEAPPASLLYAVDHRLPEGKKRLYARADLKDWYEFAVAMLTALGAQPLPPDTPYMPAVDTLTIPPHPHDRVGSVGRQKSYGKRAIQYCTAAHEHHYRQNLAYTKVLTARSAAYAKKAELALGVIYSETPMSNIYVGQPFMVGLKKTADATK